MNPDEHYPDNEKKPGPKVEDINTMHRYRDAIVVKDGNISEKLMFGAYVLFRTQMTKKSIDPISFVKV